MKKIVVIDGQGGRIGSLLVEKLSTEGVQIYAVGTNSAATAAMLKAGAHFGATGENPVVVNCRDADVITGPFGIVIADSLLGEITPVMASAVGQSRAIKVLLPINRCNIMVAGAHDLPIPTLIDEAVRQIRAVL